MHPTDVRLSREQFFALKRYLTTQHACTLCGRFPAAVNALFEPTRPELWGGQRGKTRLLGYSLCAGCYALPGEQVRLQVEARLQADLGPHRN